MFSWLANAWRVPELRRRVLFTGMILGLYRLGSWMPAPGVDSKSIQDFFGSGGRGSSILGLLNLFSGSALSRFSIFALGIMPYVTASIILQLMTVVVPKLEELQKEGEAGMAKINQYTRTGFWLVVPRQVTCVPDDFDSCIAHVGLYALHAGYRAKPVPITLNEQRWNAETR